MLPEILFTMLFPDQNCTNYGTYFQTDSILKVDLFGPRAIFGGTRASQAHPEYESELLPGIKLVN